jgi:poly(A) polymerase
MQKNAMPARPFALAVVKKLVEAGHIAYYAGGWVRDYLMQHPSDDIDIATSAPVDVVQSLFPKTIPVGVSFGIIIVMEGGHQFEVATFRKEGGYFDGRRPTQIAYATAEEDALRRDFTINGMFWDPINEKLYDYVGGEQDLKKGIIRAIGNPHERFFEDRLRMMRAVRYSTRFHFPIEEKTRLAILDHADALLPAVAMERIWQEFKKMSQFAHFDRGLITLHELRLLSTIFPRLQSVSLEEIRQRLIALSSFPKEAPTIAELLELFPDDSQEELIELCEYLKLSKQEKDIVAFLNHGKQLLGMPSAWLANLEKIEWAHFYAHAHAQLVLDIFAAHLPTEDKERFIKDHVARKQVLQSAIERIASKRPLISAEILMREGIPPGKNLGTLLKQAERLSVNQGIEDPKAIIQMLKNSPMWHSSGN